MPGRKPKIQRRQPLQARAQATYDAALEATARIIRREGLARLNTNRIAEVTGISVGTLYGYFPDKTAIVVALARRMLAEDRAELLAALQAGGDPVRNLIRALIAQHRRDPQVRRAVMSVHIGEGHGGEHGVESFLPQLAGSRALSHLQSLHLFVAARAALGVARGLVEEHAQAQRFTDGEFEDEIMRLLAGYLSPAAMRSLVSPGAARTSS
jgi:AcrR family transcriptional regulator